MNLLSNARLGGDLDCDDGTFRAEKDAKGNPGAAFFADGLEASDVFMRRVETFGQVRLLGAKLGGVLDCEGGKFRAEKDANGNPGAAIAADGLEAQGVFLSGAEVSGEVRLLGAELGGDLGCEGGKFRAQKDAKGEPGAALHADQLKTAGSVFLCRTDVSGSVRLGGAKLGGDLDCGGSKFRAEKDAKGNPGAAILADGLEALRHVFLHFTEVSGELRLRNAKLGGVLACDGGKFSAEQDAEGRRALNLAGIRVEGSASSFATPKSMVCST